MESGGQVDGANNAVRTASIDLRASRRATLESPRDAGTMNSQDENTLDDMYKNMIGNKSAMHGKRRDRRGVSPRDDRSASPDCDSNNPNEKIPKWK